MRSQGNARRIGRLPILVVAAMFLTALFAIGVKPTPALADSCGAVQLSGSSWLGGHGVDVHSNYPYQGSGTDCGGVVHNLSASPPQYGDAWQCVELAQRLYNTEGWYSGVFSGVSVAADIYSQASGGHLTDMSVQANGSITSIAPGDMIINGTSDVYSSGVGHVAIVNSVNGSSVQAVQENADSPTTMYTLSSDSLSGGGGTDILGIVHSSMDTLTNAGGYANGTFLHATDTGNVYKVAGGSPTYVPSWASVGLSSQPSLTNVTQATINSMPQYPANGTFVQDYSNNSLYEVAGGALTYVTSWSNVGGSHPYVTISHSAITSQFRQYPEDGTYLADGTSGDVYVVAGGAPMRVYSWSDIGGSEPTTEVDDWAIFNDLRQYPADGTYILDYATGNVYVVAGGAPMRVFSWSDVGGSHQVVTADDEAIQDNLLAYPVDNTCVQSYSSQDAYIIAGRSPMLVSSWSNIGGAVPCTTIDNEDLTTQLYQYPMDGTVIRNYGSGAIYVVAGGCALSIQSLSNVPYTSWTNVDGNAISSQLLSYPANGTLVEGYGSGHEYLIVSQAAVYQSPTTGSPTIIDDWAITNQLGV
jgi:hypothetical protein